MLRKVYFRGATIRSGLGSIKYLEALLYVSTRPCLIRGVFGNCSIASRHVATESRDFEKDVAESRPRLARFLYQLISRKISLVTNPHLGGLRTGRKVRHSGTQGRSAQRQPGQGFFTLHTAIRCGYDHQMIFPQLVRFTDVALLLLRIMIGVVFLASGWNHVKDPEG